MKNQIKIITIVFFLGCSSFFKPAPHPYDQKINNKRKDVGLKLIDSTFKSFTNYSTFDGNNFHNVDLYLEKHRNVRNINFPTYWKKYIHIHNKTGEVVGEDDIFRSGLNKPAVDITLNEQLIYRYMFIEYEILNPVTFKKDIFTKGWHYIHEFPIEYEYTSNYENTNYHKLKSDVLTKKEADSILKSWKLKY